MLARSLWQPHCQTPFLAAAAASRRAGPAVVPRAAIASPRWYSRRWVDGSDLNEEEVARLEDALLLETDQFGTLVLNTSVPVSIRPLDNSAECPPLDIGAMLTTAVVEVSGDANALPLTTSRNGDSLAIDATAVPDGLTLNIWLPFTMSVNVQTTEADDAATATATATLPSVTIQSIEGPVKVATKAADVTLTSCKGGRAEATTESGAIFANSIQGDIAFSSDSGEIKIRKVQALQFTVSSRTGDIYARALYSNNNNIHTKSGSVVLGAIHGVSEIISEAGDVYIGTAEGSVAVVSTTGNIDAHVCNCATVSLISESGDVVLNMPDEENATLDVSAGKVTFGSEIDMANIDAGPSAAIGLVNGGGMAAKVASPGGTAHVDHKSWFAASMALTEKLVGV